MRRPPRSIAGVWTTNAAAVAALKRVGAATWCGYVDDLLERVGQHVVSPEARTRLGAMVPALLGREGPKNCWTLAEQAGEDRPWGCSTCWLAPPGTPTRSPASCATSSPSTSAPPTRCWWWTRPAI